MVVIAVEGFDIDPGLGHAASEHPELTWDILFQSLNEHFSFRDDADADRFERLAGGAPVLEKEVGDAHSMDDPRSTPRAYSGAAQRFSHFKSAGRSSKISKSVITLYSFKRPSCLPPGTALPIYEGDVALCVGFKVHAVTSSADGNRLPLKCAAGRSVTQIMAWSPESFLPITPTASSR